MYNYLAARFQQSIPSACKEETAKSSFTLGRGWGFGSKTILLSLLLSLSCATPKEKPPEEPSFEDLDEAAAAEDLEDITESVQTEKKDYGTPHPKDNESWTLKSMMMTEARPEEGTLIECRKEIQAISSELINSADLPNAQQKLFAEVNQNQKLYHWCLYYSLMIVDSKLKSDALGKTLSQKLQNFHKEMKGLWLLSTTLGKATGSEIYFNYVRQRYIKVSEDHFARRLNVSQDALGGLPSKNRQVRSKSLRTLSLTTKKLSNLFPFNCFLFAETAHGSKWEKTMRTFWFTVITLLLVANTGQGETSPATSSGAATDIYPTRAAQQVDSSYAPTADSPTVRRFHEVLEELLVEFGHDIKKGQVKSLKNLSIRRTMISDTLPKSYANYIELLVAERFRENSRIKLISCLPCKSKSSRIINQKLVVTSPHTNMEEMARAADQLGIDYFMDIIMVYHTTHMVLAFQIFNTSSKELVWARTYNSETIRSRFQKLAVDYNQVVASRTSDEYVQNGDILQDLEGPVFPMSPVVLGSPAC